MWRPTGRCGAGTWKANEYLTKEGLDKQVLQCYNIYIESEGNAMENKWTWIDSQQVGAIWYDDYTNEEGTLCKRVWMDGEEEIWPIAKS